MEIVLLGILLFFAIIGNIMGAVSSCEESNGALYGLSLVIVIGLSIVIGRELAYKKPIEQYIVKQEWKPRLQINQQNNKQDTIYIYNLKDTVQ
jgi:hypothetical protein